jgi:hypothetical protein
MDSIVSRRVSQETPDYGFSIDPHKTADALRILAERLDKGQAFLQKATLYRRSEHDDYEMTGVVLLFAECLSSAVPDQQEKSPK